MTSTAFSIRQATQADTAELERLAQLDSSRLSEGAQYAVAEVDGTIVAAVATSTGRAIADPFRRTAELVEILRSQTVVPLVKQTRRHLSVRRGPALAA